MANVNPFQPSTSPWDQSFTAKSDRGSIVFPSGVAPNASAMVPIVQQANYNVGGVTIPAPAVSAWDKTGIQLPFDGVGTTTYPDQKFGVTASLSANASISATTSMFGGASLLLTNSFSSYIGVQYTNAPQWALAGGDFTIEGWFNTTYIGTQWCALVAHNNGSYGSGPTTGWVLIINASSPTSGTIGFEVIGGVVLNGTPRHTDGRWHHVAVTRAGTTWSLYVDGVQEATKISSAVITDVTDRLAFGGGWGFTRGFRGYLDEWRIVPGRAMYSGAAFAVPTAPFPTV